MIAAGPHAQTILVLDDVDETRSLMGRMLRDSGYRVELAYDEEDAISRAGIHSPDLILMSLGVDREQVVAVAKRIRDQAHLSLGKVIVAFLVSSLPEGAEVRLTDNLYIIRPDDFDQLRNLVRRLLRDSSLPPEVRLTDFSAR